MLRRHSASRDVRRWVAIGDAAMAFDPCVGGHYEALPAGVEAADWFLQSRPAGEAGLQLWRFNSSDCASAVSPAL